MSLAKKSVALMSDSVQPQAFGGFNLKGLMFKASYVDP